MSQSSILELLSVTNNAVKALDRTNSSKSSGSGGGTPRREEKDDDENQPPAEDGADPRSISRSSHDSGVGKTVTHSKQSTYQKESATTAHESDDSTTASDILIRSTLIEEEQTSRPPGLDSSITSQGSKCRELDNFNVADAKQVKVSKKHLREIVSPRDSYDNSTQPFKNSSTSVLDENQNSKHSLANFNTNNNRAAKSENGKVVNGYTAAAVPGVSASMTGSGSRKSFPGMRKTLNQGLDNSIPVYTVERHERETKQQAGRGFPPETVHMYKHGTVTEDLKASSGGQFPYKISRKDGSTKEQLFVEPEDHFEDWEDEQSVASSQPEIVTVTERVVNISSQALTLSDYEDSASQGSAVDAVSAANRPQSFPNPRTKSQGPGLRQGALMQGPTMPKAGKGDEVQISKFSLTDRQRELRDALAKRGSQSRPVKRVIHPKIVHSSASSVSDDNLNKNNNMDTEGRGGGGHVSNVESITAAVAASAAVAATQPFLKMQQDMESKMQSLLNEIERVQKQVGSTGTVQHEGSSGSNSRLQHLEQQVKELTEQRLQHLETLQSQQMEVQAHLLSMSRDITHGNYQRQLRSSHHPVYFPTTTNTQPPVPSKQPYSRAFIERELMKGRLQGEDGGRYVQDVSGTCGFTKQEEGSVLDTPNPRTQLPRPAEFGGEKGGLLQEILAADPSPQLNTTFKLPHGQTPPVKLSRNRRDDGGSPVEKARKLVLDLSNLEDRTAESIWSDVKTRSGNKAADEPAPLEHYLKRVRDANATPYSKLGKSRQDRGTTPSKSRSSISKTTRSTDAPVQDKYGDARSVLHSVVAERETLEKNLELMLRSRQDVDVYALMGGVSADRSEMTCIQKMVEKRITSLEDEVKREVEWDKQHNIPTTKSYSFHDMSRKPGRGGVTKPTVGFGSGAPRMSRIDTGLHKSQSLPDAQGPAGKGKKVIKARPPPKKSKIPYEDEGAMTQIYGKAQYQKGRTTVKDPYLHFQNQAKQRTSRIPSPKRPDNVVDVKSSKTQAGGGVTTYAGVSEAQVEGGAPRQYYFSPTMGYVPLTSSASAPVGGQLIPMAIPLGRPRMDSGLAVAPEGHPYPVSAEHASSTHPVRPVVTAAPNVAMVAMTAGDEEPVFERVPELGKQVLPAVDIDTLSPASSPRGSDIQIKDPDASHNAGYLETFHYQSEEEEEEGDKTLTEASDEEQQGTGISLPGYHQPTPARDTAKLLIPDRASQATRPPERTSQLREHGHVPWEERCDELAEDLRTRDVLQNKAKYWLEQELMARMLMKMHPVMSAHVDQQVELEDAADRSDSIPDDDSLLVGDTIGQKGLQLFVDVGQPVNNTLVNALVREVIAEKVGSMLGRRQEVDSADPGSMLARSTPRAAAGGAGADVGIESESEFVRPRRHAEQVPTPQPTPRTSPVPGFVSQHAPVTPPLTPPPPPLPPRDRSPVKDISSESSAPAAALVSAATSMTPQLEAPPQAAPVVYESETEASASLDISEELRVLDGKVKPAQTFATHVDQSQHNVVTPTSTPPPSPPPQPTQDKPAATPPPSPPVQPVPPPPAPKEEVVRPKQQVMESKSPQPWGNPDSPGPELNPNFEEPTDVGHPQPKPLMMSVAVGTEAVVERRRSPSPQRRRATSVDQSDLDSVSSASSATNTFNENVSEGQWLVSRSEGQVAGLPVDDDIRRAAVEAVRKVDTSTASTLRDTEDLDLDDTDVSRSEGEFLHKGDVLNPETDPVLALLMQMQHQPGGFRQYDLPANRVQQVLTGTNVSMGEVGRNGGLGSTRKSMSELSEGQVLPGNRVTVVAPKMASPPPQEGERYRGQGIVRTDDRGRSVSPSGRRSSNAPRSRTPQGTRGQHQYQPVSSGLPPSQSRRPLKSALVRSSDDSLRYSRDSEQDFDRRGPPTEYGTRTLTPDQLNTDALLQSGYIGRSMGSSGRQESTKKSVEFDLSGTYESRRESSYRGSDDGFNSTPGTSDRLSSSGRSLGLKYSFEDTGSERELRSSGLRMSVTIPTTENGSESDVSEIDVSDNTGY